MSFRTVEITGPAELHVKSGLLIIEKDFSGNTETRSVKLTKQKKKKEAEVAKISIPLEDISTIICMGAAVRISTMAMAQLCQHTFIRGGKWCMIKPYFPIIADYDGKFFLRGYEGTLPAGTNN